jgi:helicase
MARNRGQRFAPLKYWPLLSCCVSRQAARVDTLVFHEEGEDYHVIVERDGERLFRGRLELKHTDAGPRPARLRVVDGTEEDLRSPDEFLDIARRADRRRITEQTSRAGRQELRAMLDGYQLGAKTVRTCAFCASAGRYTPITADSAIETETEDVCPDCASEELDRQLAYQGDISGSARDRLEELLLDVQDLERITNLLKGRLDPELTKFDEISPTVEDVDPVPVDSLSLHPGLQGILEARFDTLLPVQSLAVENGLLDGQDQLVVSATATGKTLVGEMAGIHRALSGQGTFLFLVPLVALANQKYRDFQEEYGDLVDVTLRVGASRINDSGARFDPSADVIVGTYEGIDHALRTGKDLGSIGTVVIDEVHTVGEEGRGHRLDGLISRLKHVCEQKQTDGRENGESGDATGGTQWIYLSATVGNPEQLARALRATLIEFEERPVPIERHLTFADEYDKVDIENRLVRRAFDSKSSKGYRGQTIVFTNSRRRCHEISRRLEYSSAPYHAGLDNGRRKRVEEQFADQELAAVVTTAALAAGVDFPASQVIFDSLAMGIEWLSVQEFSQMLGRAGRPDYHDTGTVYLLVEPDGSYHGSQEMTEDEVAFKLLKGEMEPVQTRYDESAAVEETLANVTVGGAHAKALNEAMVGEVPTKYALGKLLEYEFIDGLDPTPLGRAVTTHFLSPGDAFALLEGIRSGENAYDLVARMEARDERE